MKDNYFVGNIEEATLKNDFFRKVLFTGEHSQLVVMALKPGEEIGEETHEVDQFLRFEEGEGEVVLNNEVHEIGADDAVVIPAGTKHNVVNTSKTNSLKLYTVYSPPEHPDGTVHETKEEAEAYEREHHEK